MVKKRDLKKELAEVMDERGLSLSALARSVGLSPAALSQWLNGKYAGNVTRIEEAVKSFLDRQYEKVKAPKREIEFVMTSVAKKVFEVARICHLDGEIGVVYGDAGLGKTVSVKEYAKRNLDVILIEADLGYTAKVLFEELHKKLGYDGRGTIHAMFEDVVAKLRDSERLIIIDEAEHLPYRALELLRRVHDKSGIGILLVGMPRLIANLRGKRGEYAQLYSRVGIAGRLETLKPADTQEIINSLFPGSNGLWKAFHQACYGNTRTLSKLIFRSIRVAEINGMDVTPEIVKETAKMLII